MVDTTSNRASESVLIIVNCHAPLDVVVVEIEVHHVHTYMYVYAMTNVMLERNKSIE